MSDDIGRAIGNTLSGGIQDISALLPLLGTEQCEQHVGAALDKGYLYAAATPLSIFGSLGIVKTAFSTLAATTTYPFHGARWLKNAGFTSSGTISSLVTIQKGSKEYDAEVRFRRLIEDQHIEDPRLVSDVVWSGWKIQVGDSGKQVEEYEKQGQEPKTNFPKVVLPWNIALILVSAILSVVSISPYLYLIRDRWNDPLAWLFPVFRSFGSFLCVVCTQLALQRRIHRIVRSRLLLLQYQKLKNDRDTSEKGGLESALRAHFPRGRDTEKAQGEEYEGMRRQAVSLLAFDWLLCLYQVTMAVGIGMVVVGYIGCFNLVGSQDPAKNGPYIWVGLESFLSLFRILLWGLNPDWDGSTGLELSLKLLPKDIPLPGGGLEPYFPPITTAVQFPADRNATFVAHPRDEFLRVADTFTGPLPRFEAKDIALLYAVMPLSGRSDKVLCTVVVFANSHVSICLVIDDSATPQIVTSTWQVLPETTTVLVTLGDLTQANEISLSREVFNNICKYSHRLATLLFGQPCKALPLEWKLTLKSGPPTGQGIVPLTGHDRQYIEIRKDWSHKSTLMRRRGETIRRYVRRLKEGKITRGTITDWLFLFLFETLFLEMFLCKRDHDFATHRGSDKSLPRRVVLEGTAGARERMEAERKMIEPMYPAEGHSYFASLWEKGLLDLQQSQFVDASSGYHELAKDILNAVRRRTLSLGFENLFSPFVTHNEILTVSRILIISHPEASREFQLELELLLLRFHLLCLNRSMELQSQLKDAVSAFYFLRPYLALNQVVSEYHIHGLARNHTVSVLQMRLPAQEVLTVNKFLGQLASMDSINQLTTLDVTNLPISPDLPGLLSDVLAKHANIVVLMCPLFAEKDQTMIRDRLLDNWKEWWQSKQSNSTFQYLVAFEADDATRSTTTASEEELETPFRAAGDLIHLHEGRVECLILVYTPSSGQATFTFSVSASDGDEVQAKVRFKADTETDWTCVPESASERLSWGDNAFPVVVDLGEGNHEVRVRLSVVSGLSLEDKFLPPVHLDVTLRDTIRADFSPK